MYRDHTGSTSFQKETTLYRTGSVVRIMRSWMGMELQDRRGTKKAAKGPRHRFTTWKTSLCRIYQRVRMK
jgi:hypothetical protein